MNIKTLAAALALPVLLAACAPEVESTIYLADMNDFAVVNQTYAEYFPNAKPARATVAVAGLPRNCKVEIDMIALA